MPNSVEIAAHQNSVSVEGPNSVTVEAIEVKTTWYFLSENQIIPEYLEVAA